MLGAPFSLTRINTGVTNADATFQAPFAQPFPTPESFPLFPRLFSDHDATINLFVAPNFRPAMVQQFSLNVQAELHKGWLLEVGYVGDPGNTPGTPTFPESSAGGLCEQSDQGCHLKHCWPILHCGFPFPECLPTLFARWNPRAAPGTTG